jgi:WD40 repeat protein
LKIISLTVFIIILIFIPNDFSVYAQIDKYDDSFDRLTDVEWKPDDSYAIIVGEKGTVLIYDGIRVTDISYNIHTDTDLLSVSWKPDGSYALIVGNDGTIYKYDGSNFVSLTNQNIINGRLFRVKWDLNGTYALIIERKIFENEFSNSSYNIIKYDGTTFSYLRKDNEHFFTSITFKPSNNNAYIFGSDLILIYNGSEFDELPISKWEYHEAAWSPNNEYLFAVSLNGVVFKFDEDGNDIALSTPTNLGYNCIDWNNNNDALLGGFDLILYRSKENNFIHKSDNLENIYISRAIDWANNDSCALIVGSSHYFSSSNLIEHGVILKFDGDEITFLLGEIEDIDDENGDNSDRIASSIYLLVNYIVLLLILFIGVSYYFKKYIKQEKDDIIASYKKYIHFGLLLIFLSPILGETISFLTSKASEYYHPSYISLVTIIFGIISIILYLYDKKRLIFLIFSLLYFIWILLGFITELVNSYIYTPRLIYIGVSPLIAFVGALIIFFTNITLILKDRSDEQKFKKYIFKLSLYLIIIIHLCFFYLLYNKPKIDGRISFLFLETILFLCLIFISLLVINMNQKLKATQKKLKSYLFMDLMLIIIFSIIHFCTFIHMQYFASPIGGIATIGEGMTSLEIPPYHHYVIYISSSLITISVALMIHLTKKYKGNFDFDI